MSEAPRLADFLSELDKQVAGDLRTDRMNRILYSTDASIYQVMPHGVLIPKTTDDLFAAVELAAEYEVPLLPRTAGSSLAGQAVNEALVIDFTRHLDQVLEVNVEEHWVRVQPGIVLDELNLYLRPYGLQFGPDPASSNRAAMGGIVSNNSTGAHSILYGMTADHVLETNVILNDGSGVHFRPLDTSELIQAQERSGREGEIYRQINQLVGQPDNQAAIIAGTPRHWRRCGGYNLDRLVADPSFAFLWPKEERFNLSDLICGAEGTLGMMTEIKLNLVPLPKMSALAIIQFEDLATALSAVPVILQVKPTAVELLDNLGLTLCRKVPEYARLLQTFLEGQPNCVLITEFYGQSEAELRDKLAELQSVVMREKTGATVVTPAIDRQLQANIWKVRKVGLGLMMSVKGDHKPIPFIEDAAVPPEHLAEYVTRLEKFCNDMGTNVAYYAHASAGCIHIRPLINNKVAAEIAKMPQIVQFATDMLHGYEGSLSSEHGDGRARSWINEHFFGPELYELYRQVKQIFDPNNLFNPGNIVDAGPMIENLRLGEDYQVISLTPYLDYSEDMGFDRAVETCNGAGICRQRLTGTMCPSFMVTRDEKHSTRGRANGLRAVLSGQLPPSELTGPDLYEVMELCVACKACKAECPSAVDMAKIKFEYLAHYHKANGKPLRSRLFGHIGSLNRIGSGSLAPLSNAVLKSGAAKSLLGSTMGISRERSLPTLARTPLPTWFKQRNQQAPASPAPLATPQVALFHDPFTNYNTPEVGIAAVELLEAAGFEVLWPGHKDDGRPFISKGLVDEARATALDTLAHLLPLAEKGIPIVGLEPSSLLTLRDDYFFLLPDDKRVPMVAEHAFTFEEFIARLADDDQLDLTFTEEPCHILLHGHCHQKALIGTGPAIRALTLPPNYSVTEVDSGCCGMAGSFGYEAEHYDISLQMAERRLLPAVRETATDTIIVAAGTSCREQIKHGAERHALHPAEVLNAALV
jgi:FAD/FMN-containing dehydrogenase/Fe-S oxidoreductase